MPTPITGNPFDGLNPKSIDHLPEASAASEWYLLKNDLQTSLKTAHLLSQRAVDSLNSEENRLICESLCRDTIVQFISCFQKNKQFSLNPEIIYRDWPQGLEHFRYVESLRNAYAAHRHGPQRQCVVAVYMDGAVVNSIGPVFVTFHVPGPGEMLKLMKLIEIALQTVEQRIGAASDLIFQQLEDMTAPQFLELKEPSWDEPLAEHFDMPRKAFRARGTSAGQGRRPRKGRAGNRP